MFEGFFAFFNRGDVGIAIGAIIAAATYLLQREKRTISFNIKSFIFEIPKKITGNDVRFLINNLEVSKIFMNRIIIWNSGNRDIDGNDVSKSAPLKITGVDESKLIDFRIVHQSHTACDLRIEYVDNFVRLKFDKIPKKHGFVVDIVSKEEFNNLELIGFISDTKLKKSRIELVTKNESSRMFIVAIFSSLFTSVSLFLLNYVGFLEGDGARAKYQGFIFILSIFICGFLIGEYERRAKSFLTDYGGD